MTNAELLDRIFADRPPIHRIAETGAFRADRSALSRAYAAQIASLTGLQNWAPSKECARFIADTARPGMRTLETGIGLSTLAFAMSGANHITVAPHQIEMDELKKYADSIGVDMSRVTFVASGSETALPEMRGDLDIVFIDGMHAFPWPILDWFFTADRLKAGGLMMLDDTQMPPVAVLSEFLKADAPRWRFCR